MSFKLCKVTISPLISSSILGTYRPGEFLFQYPIILPFHTVHGVLKARILKWFAGPGQSSFQKASCLGMRRGLASMPMAESCGCILTPRPSHHSSDSHSLCQGEPGAGQRWPWTNTSDCNTCAFILRYTR